jgi:hypothetical protein
LNLPSGIPKGEQSEELMNVHKTQAKSIKARRHTDAESHSLHLVASHSGYLFARQFLAFAGAHWSKRTAPFWNRLQPNQHVRLPYKASLTPGPASRQANMMRFCEVNASPKVVFTGSFTPPFTLRENLARSSERTYLRFQDGSCTWTKHRAGLERPHFVAAESAAVAPAQLGFTMTRSIAEPCTDVRSRV